MPRLPHIALLTLILANASACNSNGEADSPAASPTQSSSEEPEPGTAGAVLSSGDEKTGLLRHAVFFQFKPESSAEQIEDVVTAFEALPGKISEIIDFEWGVNNSPEKLDDGFTHCFVLTFRDEAGRAAYLPHEAHKAFGDVLRPHMSKVFVIDYWGDQAQPVVEKPLRHAVFFAFKKQATDAQIQEVEQAFAHLPSKIDGIKAFEWGVNNSPEKHDDGFTHCFMVTFDSEEARAAYLPHAAHQEFVTLLQPVLEKARVLDFWAQ